MKSSTKRTILLVFAIFFVMAMFVCLFTACGGHSVGTSTGGDDNHQIYPGDNQANNPGGNQGNTPGDNQGNTPGGDQGQNNNPPENEYDNLDVISSLSYSQEGENDVVYTYQYSLTIEENAFTLLIAAIGSDGSFRMEEKKGSVEINEGNGVIALIYEDNSEPDYIKETARGFVFCDENGASTVVEDNRETHAAIDIVPRRGNSVYGYYDLSLLENGEKMQALYYDMYNICEAFLSSEQDLSEESKYLLYSFNLSNYGLATQDAVAAWKVFYIENPWYFFLSNGLSFSKNMMLLTVNEEYAKHSDRAQAIQAINKLIEDCNAAVDENDSELEKALSIHDFLIEQMDYAYVPGTTTPSDEIWAHNIVGGAMKNLGVCESYAKIFALLCRLQGFDCIIVSGKGGNEAHAWNLLNIDDVWYCVDVTWDDIEDKHDSTHDFFGMAFDNFSSNHKSERNTNNGVEYLYGLPTASETGLQLVKLYENETCLGVYGTIDMAFEVMTKSDAEYTIELFNYNSTGAALLRIPNVVHEINSSLAPRVKKITITGNLSTINTEYSYNQSLYVYDLELQSDLEIVNISLVLSELNINTYTLYTSGDHCKIIHRYAKGIFGAKDGVLHSAIINNAARPTEIFCSIDVHTVKGLFYSGSKNEGNKMDVVDSYGLSLYQDADVHIKNAYVNGDTIEQDSNVIIENLYIEKEIPANDSIIMGDPYITIHCTDSSAYPNIQITNQIVSNSDSLFLYLDLYRSGLVTDLTGKEVGRYEEKLNINDIKDLPLITLPNKEMPVTVMYARKYANTRSNTIICPTTISNDNKVYIKIDNCTQDKMFITDNCLWNYEGSAANLTIPNGITSIGDSAFEGHSELKSITIPNSVTSIGESAFMRCNGLTSVVIPNGVTSIGASAFNDCKNLEMISIPNSVTNIGRWISSGCNKLRYNRYGNADYLGSDANPYLLLVKPMNKNITSCEIHENCRFIEKDAFWNCSNLSSITIPKSITRIDDYQFSGCSQLNTIYYSGSLADWCAMSGLSNLTTYRSNLYIEGVKLEGNITIPNTVTSIADFAFIDCYNLTSVVISAGVTNIGKAAFYGCSGLTSIVIPNSVTSIGENAFYGCDMNAFEIDAGNAAYKVEGACLIETKTGTLIMGCDDSVIPTDGSVEHIGDYAFYRCSGLTSIVIPSCVTSIGDFAFRDSGLTSVVFDDDSQLQTIGESAFEYCRELTTFVIPKRVNSIGDFAFRDSGLASVVFDDDSQLQTIGERAFEHCIELTTFVIPKRVNSIGVGIFADCSALQTVEVESGNTNYYIAGNCLIETESKTLIWAKSDSVIPTDSSVEHIGDYAFYRCSGLTAIVIPNSITSIGYRSFSGCSELISIELSNQLNDIGDYAFSGCSGLTSIVIPNSVTKIGSYAFYGCGMTSISVPSSVKSIKRSAFSNPLISIEYDGTKAQWEKVIEYHWYEWYNWINWYQTHDKACTVHCSDGDIIYQAE